MLPWVTSDDETENRNHGKVANARTLGVLTGGCVEKTTSHEEHIHEIP